MEPQGREAGSAGQMGPSAGAWQRLLPAPPGTGLRHSKDPGFLTRGGRVEEFKVQPYSTVSSSLFLGVRIYRALHSASPALVNGQLLWDWSSCESTWFCQPAAAVYCGCLVGRGVPESQSIPESTR